MVEVITERRSPLVWLTIGSSGGTLKDKKTDERLVSLKPKEASRRTYVRVVCRLRTAAVGKARGE